MKIPTIESEVEKMIAEFNKIMDEKSKGVIKKKRGPKKKNHYTVKVLLEHLEKDNEIKDESYM